MQSVALRLVCDRELEIERFIPREYWSLAATLVTPRGDVFQARVDIDSSTSVRDLMFSIGYEKSRLALVGRSDGEFVRQSGVPHEFGVDEPSDGNIVVIYNARNGSSTNGAGTIVIFEFEAIGAGTSAIVLHDVTANDGGGEANPNIVIADERVTIH